MISVATPMINPIFSGRDNRRHGMASVFADTAGRAHEGYAIRIPYLAAGVAAALAGQLSAAAARTSFRW